MPTITCFEEIEAWQTAGELTKPIYLLTEESKFSRDLDYITQEQYSKAFAMAEKASRQTAHFISYLEMHPRSQKLREDSAEYKV